MRIAVVDDDSIFRENLAKRIEQACKELGLENNILKFHDDKVLKSVSELDVIFLDIEMPDISGIQIADEINKSSHGNDIPLIIFVTCKDQMVFPALKMLPFAFIKKSEIDDDIEGCLKKAYKSLSLRNKVLEKHLIKDSSGRIFISINDIFYIQKDKNYIIYHTKQGDYRERSLISKKEAELRDKGFVKVNSGCIINISHIFAILKDSVTLDDKSVIPVSKPYKKMLDECYFERLVRKL